MPTAPAGRESGLRILPFRAVRYSSQACPDLAAVIAPPYDVIDDAQRAELEARDPHNVVRLILPRSPRGAGSDGGGDQYAHAAQLFDEWRREGYLVADDEPALYLYQQRRGEEIVQRGLFGAAVLEPLDGGVILPHERVRPGPVADRLALMRAMLANPEPIFLLYDGGGAATAACATVADTPASRTATTDDGLTHELWPIDDPATLEAIAGDLATRRAMIADGHHRYTTYGYLRDELVAAGSGPGPWDAGLALLVDASVTAPRIDAIHRVVPGLSLAQAVQRAQPVFRSRELPPGATLASALAALTEAAADETATSTPRHAYAVTDGESFVLLDRPDTGRLDAARPDDHTAAWWRLDASVAAVLLMGELWGVDDASDEVDAEHDAQAALRMARDAAGIALLLNPAALADIWAVAEAGDAMPRKSTLFLPKPRSGVVMRAFDLES